MNKNFENKIKDSVILITGGTGSFGNSVVDKLVSLSPKKIIIFSRDEKKQYDMRNKYNNPLLKFVIGDVREESSVNRVVEGVDYIFHAAALKQVPACEFFPMEAVKTNVVGTHNVLEAAARHKVKRVVVLSTDKAVYPINAMGMTKALMEKTMIAESKNYTPTQNSTTVFCAVRYGNVLYSRASVLPYFVDLIKQGEKLRITNPNMTRFLLPLADAVNLVLFAMSDGDNGCIYVKKAPACTVKVMADAVSKLFDFNKGTIEVGVRAGEKFHETLLSAEEMVRAIELKEYFKIPPETEGLDYNKYLFQGVGGKYKLELNSYTSENTTQLNISQTASLLATLPDIKEELEEYRSR